MEARLRTRCGDTPPPTRRLLDCCWAAVYCLVLQEARLRDIMDDLHLSFKQRVRASRGERLTGRDEELFSGRALGQIAA